MLLSRVFAVAGYPHPEDFMDDGPGVIGDWLGIAALAVAFYPLTFLILVVRLWSFRPRVHAYLKQCARIAIRASANSAIISLVLAAICLPVWAILLLVIRVRGNSLVWLMPPIGIGILASLWFVWSMPYGNDLVIASKETEV